MNELFLDLETFSSVDLGKCGVYKYAASPDFEVLLFAYSVDGGEVQVVDIAGGEDIPDEILAALEDDKVTKWSFNCQFERVCISSYLGLPVGTYLSPDSWRCSMIWAAYLGLPQSLAGAGAVLQVDKKKLEEGKDLIKYFCVPCKRTKANGGRERNRPEDAPEKWDLFKRYNVRDVETEMEIQQKLSRFPVPESVWEEFIIDQEINDRGILVDMEMVENAIRIDEKVHEELTDKMKELTELDNPQSVQQLKSWLADNGLEMDSLGKDVVKEAMKAAPEPLREVLTLRQQISKSSVKKYVAMENVAGEDNRARGTFRFYGANRSGRFSGRGIQLQNLPQNHLPDLEEARGLVKAGNYEALSLLYDDIPDTLSQLIRTAFIPSKGKRYYVADFSSIEARVLSWIAGEQWRIDAFKDGKDIYCMSASSMFGVPVEKHGVNGHLRAKGKIAELACIARGSLVLTERGLIPIERVVKRDRVWDGLNWVEHDGVVFKGIRRILHYDGLSATEDHLVFVEGRRRPIPFGDAVRGRMPLRRRERKVFSPEYYTGFAPVYDILNAGSLHRFTVSGCLVHNCGYGGSVGAMKAMGAGKMGLSDDEIQEIVTAWRYASPNIVKFWWDVDRAVMKCMKEGGVATVKCLKFRKESGMLIITLPSGRELFYVKPRIGENKFGGECVTYEGREGAGKWGRVESYGPKFVENCIAKGVQVVTSRGLVPIENIAADDLIWDGVEWVSHDGLIYQGKRETVSVGEIRMTPDHKILTEKGWMPCGEAEGFDWAAVTPPKEIAIDQMKEDRITIRTAARVEKVYDIRNCGPRHRFAVYDGGKLRIVSNCIQGISRDILCYAMRTLRNYDIVAHIHDELVIEAPPETSLDEICELMGRTPPWAEGLLLRADGFVSDFYKKDD